MSKVISKSLLLLLFILMYVTAWFMQEKFLFKGDVSWQMHLARLVLSGGQYVKDFFEINPPLSIYLYMPAVLLQKKLAISGIIALRIYMFLFATSSLVICHFLLNKIFIKKDNVIHLLFLLMLAFVYLILPLCEFGQRECMLLYLTMPYFLLISLRLNETKISFSTAASIGILAGLGFSIKPFFVFSFILVEGYFILRQIHLEKRFINCIRTENSCIFLIFIFYIIFIYYYHPTYIKTVLPLASRFYYQFFSIPLTMIFFNPLIIYIVLTPIFYFLLPIRNQYKSLFRVLTIALIGFLAAYLVQQLPWYYHALPALSFALIINVLLFGLLLKQNYSNTLEFLFIALLGLFVFLYPIYFIKNYNEKSMQIKEYTQPLIKELSETEKNKYVFFFSSNAAYMVSVLEHANALHASRLQFLAWMQGYFRLKSSQFFPLKQKKDEDFFVNMLVEDIKKNKPDLIYVDQSEHITYRGISKKLDYIKILSTHSNFKDVWKTYHYWKTVKNPQLYKFDIYKKQH